MPTYAFTLNDKKVTVDAPADMPLLWVLRDLLGVTGPKYGCGVGELCVPAAAGAVANAYARATGSKPRKFPINF